MGLGLGVRLDAARGHEAVAGAVVQRVEGQRLVVGVPGEGVRSRVRVGVRVRVMVWGQGEG